MERRDLSPLRFEEPKLQLCFEDLDPTIWGVLGTNSELARQIVNLICDWDFIVFLKFTCTSKDIQSRLERYPVNFEGTLWTLEKNGILAYWRGGCHNCYYNCMNCGGCWHAI